MKGNDKVIAVLNTFLADELTAISQYIVHSEMCANWQYGKLHEAIEKRAIEEMKHAEKLIARILFLEGKPIVSQLNKISIGADRGGAAEERPGGRGRRHQGLQRRHQDLPGSRRRRLRELIEDNLEDEEEHLDWLEAQVDQIAQMGLQNYLLSQTA